MSRPEQAQRSSGTRCRNCAALVPAYFREVVSARILSRVSLLLVAAVLVSGTTLRAEDDVTITLKAPKGWSGETLKLPPGFARDMKLKGIEEIRFAPGMFKPDSESFFSYAFVFWLPGDTPLEADTIHSEIMTYYRGLATAVSKGEIKTDGFKLKLEAVEKKESEWVGTLEWVEPFRTSKAQTLRFEISQRQLSDPDARLLSVAVSPQQDEKQAVWTDLRAILKSASFARVEDGK